MCRNPYAAGPRGASIRGFLQIRLDGTESGRAASLVPLRRSRSQPSSARCAAIRTQPDLVEQAFEAFSKFDWTGPKAVELQALFLCAARVVNHRALDVPQSVRNRIAQKLEKADVPSSKTLPLKQYMTMDRSERVSLFGESLPPGLIMREASTG